jgi:hypothetical protein
MLLTPSWLYYLFGGLMLAVGAYGVLLLGLAVVTRRYAGVDVEISHVAMGLAMAGMFVESWYFGPDALWELVFGVLLVWFAVRGIRSVQTFGLHLPHTWVHALMSFAMLVMYWFPMGSSAGRSVGMSMTAGGAGGRLDPGLAFLLVVALLASAVFTLASRKKGGVVYGTHVKAAEAATGAGVLAADAYLADTLSSAGGVESVVAAPALLDAAHVVMAVGMAFMLVLML